MTPETVRSVLAIAMAEDRPWGDVSAELFIPEDSESHALLRARVPGVMAGMSVFAEAMRWESGGRVSVVPLSADGEHFAAGEVLAEVTGPTRLLLGNERVALNLVQRMCAVATMTASLVALVSGRGSAGYSASGPQGSTALGTGSRVRVSDTRKTTPGLRALEKCAVRCGGGYNHRFSLSDAIMLKDNHLAAIFAAHTRDGALDLHAAAADVRERARSASHTTHLEIEVDRPELIDFALDAGAGTIMLDNFSVADVAAAVHYIDGRALCEVSGNVNAATIADYAETGVDIISVGALTHSAPSVDLGLDFVDAGSRRADAGSPQ